MHGTSDQEILRATRTFAVPAATVFAVLADPGTHAAIDGTGWIQECVDRTPLTGLGQVFRMDMHHPRHPEVDYQVVNKVHVFDQDRSIGWLTGTDKGGGRLDFGGWFWRYDLAPMDPAGAEVTLSYDWSAVPPAVRNRGIPFPPFGVGHLTNSLRHLAELAEPASS